MGEEHRGQHVVVMDFDMPFGSMVRFIIKWTLAAIPAAIIMSVVGTIIWLSIAGVVASVVGVGS